MIQRSIELGDAEDVIVRAGQNCTVQGYDGDRVLAECDNHQWGMNVRIVVKVDRFELFRGQWGTQRGARITAGEDAIEVNAGGSCTVMVPAGCAVTVYAGSHASVEGVQGPVLVNAGGDVRINAAGLLAACNAGGEMDLSAERLTADEMTFSAGKDLRIHVRDLDDAAILVNDLGGYWEGVIGNGTDTVRLKSGGAVTLVTDRPVRGKVLGNIEAPRASTS
jgi:hypothetical protein